MTLTPSAKIHLKNVFRTNMSHAGFTSTQADHELGFLMATGFVVGTRHNYLMARRKGAPFLLTRTQRIHIYEIFSSSVNQVYFELGM